MSSRNVQEEYPLVGSYGESQSKWFYVGAIAFVCWNILLFSLAVAAIAKVNNIKEPSSDHTVPVFSQSASVVSADTIPLFSTVSLLSNGTIRKGAGVTIYSKTTPPPFGTGSKNVRVARFVENTSEDHVLVIWTNNTGSFGCLATLSLNKNIISAWYTAVAMPFPTFSDVLVLSGNHFIIATEQAVFAGNANTNPGAMNFTTLARADYPEAPVWKDIRLTALGLSNFVVSYDTGYIAVNESTTFGAVVGSVIWNLVNKQPNVTFLTARQTWEGGFPVHDVFPLSDTTFVATYGTVGATPQLSCMIGRFNSAANPPTLTFGTAAVLPSIQPEFYLSAVGLTNSSGLVIVVDKASSFALKAVMVHRDPYAVDGIHFGDVVTVEQGVADSFYTNQFKGGVLPFLDASRIKDNKVVVAWADYSNSGRLTTSVVTVDQVSNLHAAPPCVVGQPLSLDQLQTYSISVAGLSADQSELYGAVIVDTLGTSAPNLALVEVAGSAFGVATHDAHVGNTLKVVVSGIIDLPSRFPDLKTGHLYYGRTDGSLEAGPAAGATHVSDHYLTLPDNTIVSRNSAVGVAVNKRQLYILPNFHL